MLTYSPSVLDFLPVEVISEHWAECPVLDSRFLLVTYFMHSVNTVCVSVGCPKGYLAFFQMTRLCHLLMCGASLVAQTVKRLPIMRETWVRSLGRENPLEMEMATRFSTLAWKIPWTEDPGRLQSMASQRVGHDWATSPHFFTSRNIVSLFSQHHNLSIE